MINEWYEMPKMFYYNRSIHFYYSFFVSSIKSAIIYGFFILKFHFQRFFFLFFSFSETDIIPNASTDTETREFLLKVIDILLDYVKSQNDRGERILEFHHPEEMKNLLDLDLPDTAVPLQQLIQDCAKTMKYQVRTGK